MTTPHQPAENAFGTATDMVKMLGLGAFKIGGGEDGTRFGQHVTEGLVRSLVHGAAPGLIHSILDIPHFFHQLAEFLKTLPLEALQMLQEFIPGAVLDDFATVAGAVEKIIGALAQDLRVTLQMLLKLFAVDQLHQCFVDFRETLSTIDWLNPASVRNAYRGFWQFVRDLGAWVVQVVHNLADLATPDEISDLMHQLLAPLELPVLRDAFKAFVDTWFSLDWTHPATAMVAGWSAVVTLGRAVIHWAEEVVHNFLGVRSPGFFSFDHLRDVWHTFQSAWGSLDWTHPVSSFQTALRAIGQVIKGLWGWVMGVLNTIFGIDLSPFGQAFLVPQLKSVWSAFNSEWGAVTWLPIPHFRPALLAVAHLANGLWGWLIDVLNNLFGFNLRKVGSAFQPDVIKGVWSTFTAAWNAVVWFPIPHFRDAVHAVGRLVNGTWSWLIDVAKNVCDVDLRKLGAAFEPDYIKWVWSTFRTEWDAVVWLPIPHFRAAIAALAHLVRGAWRWFMDLVLNLFGVDIRKVGSAFEPDVIQGVWSTFRTSWSAIHWSLPEAIPDMRAGVRAVKELVHGTVSWVVDVFRNLTEIDPRHAFAAFELPFLRNVISTFQTAWAAVGWFTPGAFRRALSAVVDFVGGIRDWIIRVVNNIVNIDLSGLRDALALGTLRAAIATFLSTVASLNWGTPVAALMSFIGAVSALARGIGNWVLLLLHNLIGLNTTTIHQMFSSVANFIEGIIRFVWGDSGVAAWHAALDFLTGFSNSTPWGAVIAFYQQLKDMMDKLSLPKLGGLKDFLDAMKANGESFTQASHELLQALQQGFWDALANGLGHLGNGFLANDIKTFIQNIPHINIKAILGTTSLGQDVLDFVDTLAHALGFAGPGHTLANLLSYFSSFPGDKIASVLGQGHLKADLQALGNLLFGSPTVGSTIRNTIIQAALSGGAHLGDDMQKLATRLFGGIGLPGSSSFVQLSSIQNALGKSHLGADIQALGTLLFGSATVGSFVQHSAIQAALTGGLHLGDDMQKLATRLFGGIGSPGSTSFVQNAVIQAALGKAHLGADLQALGTLLFGSATVGTQVRNNVIQAVLGGAHLGADLQSFAVNLLGSATSSGSVLYNRIPSLPNIWGGTIHGSRLTGASSVATSLLTGVMAQAQIPSLDAFWGGTVHGSRLTGALNTALTVGSMSLQAIADLTNLIKTFINNNIVPWVNQILAGLRVGVGVVNWPANLNPL